MKTSTRNIIIKLKYFNRWRTGAEIPMPAPKEVTALIRATIDELKYLSNENDKLKRSLSNTNNCNK
mgnify:CR=1 FL=1